MSRGDTDVFVGTLRRRVLGPISAGSAGVRLTLGRDALTIEPAVRARSMFSFGATPTWLIAWADVEGAATAGPRGVRFSVRGRPGFVFFTDRRDDLIARLGKRGVRVDR